MKNISVFDIDGVLMKEDKPNQPIVNAIRELHRVGVGIVFLTARDNDSRERTHSDIKQAIGEIPYKLIMVGYQKGVPQRKVEELKKLKQKYFILCFRDDTEANIALAKEEGFITRKV